MAIGERPDPDVLRTRIHCALMQNLCLTSSRLATLMRPLVAELVASIYSSIHVSHRIGGRQRGTIVPKQAKREEEAKEVAVPQQDFGVPGVPQLSETLTYFELVQRLEEDKASLSVETLATRAKFLHMGAACLGSACLPSHVRALMCRAPYGQERVRFEQYGLPLEGVCAVFLPGSCAAFLQLVIKQLTFMIWRRNSKAMKRNETCVAPCCMLMRCVRCAQANARN